MRFEVDFGFDIYKSGFGEKLGEKVNETSEKESAFNLESGCTKS